MAESPISIPSPTTDKEKEKAWLSYISEDLPRTVQQSTDSAIRSARSFQQSSSVHFRAFQEFLPQLRSRYKTYEHIFFQKVKDELISAKEHPAAASGITVTTCLLLMRGPRRFFFRHTLGQFQSEEARFVRVEKNMRELNLSVDLMKKESRKLAERAALAQKDTRRGQSDLAKTGGQIRSLVKSVYKAEAEATGFCMLGNNKHHGWIQL